MSMYRIEEGIEMGTEEKNDGVVDLDNDKMTTEDDAAGDENVTSSGTNEGRPTYRQRTYMMSKDTKPLKVFPK